MPTKNAWRPRRACAQGREPRSQGFTDYRKMFDKLGKQIDAVFIATPNHHHALPAMIAMQLGKGVYCEKPLCHDIAEARKLAEMAAATQSRHADGKPGALRGGLSPACASTFGPARSARSPRPTVGPIAPTAAAARGRPSEPVPAGLHWDEWIGPAPYRDFHGDLHPHEWHGWYDFGNGSLGNMACHVLDGVYWALKLEHPTSIEAEEIFGGTDERYPIGTTHPLGFPRPRRHARREGLLVRRPPRRRRPGDHRSQGRAEERDCQGDRTIFRRCSLELQKKYPGREIRLQRLALRGRKGDSLYRLLRRRHARRAQGQDGGDRRAAQVAAAAAKLVRRFPAGRAAKARTTRRPASTILPGSPSSPCWATWPSTPAKGERSSGTGPT